MDKSTLEKAFKNGIDQKVPYFEEGIVQDSVDSYIEKNPHRPASVLICLSCPDEVIDIENIEILYTLRTDEMPSHKGQISFPGGKQSEGESAFECALRETYEEVGVEKSNFTIIGKMPLYPSLISRFLITPVIAYFKNPLTLKVLKSTREKSMRFLEHLYQNL